MKKEDYIKYKQETNRYIITDINNTLDDFFRRLKEYNYQLEDKISYKVFECLKDFLEDLNIQNENIQDIKSESDSIFLKLKNIKCKLRSLKSILAGALTSNNWQSPAINSSLGVTRMVAENIKEHFNEYKRDRSYQTSFLEEQLSQKLFRLDSGKHVLNVTSSGMGALTVINAFIQGEIKPERIMVSSHVYFENMLMINKLYGDKVVCVDSHEENVFIQEILDKLPDVVFLDMVNNKPNLPLINVSQIIKEVSLKLPANKKIFFVSDITITIGSENLLNKKNTANKNVYLIIFGSLLKLPQVGLDRVNMGFIISSNLDNYTNKMLDYRTFTGTNVSDISALSYPVITKDLLKQRMKQINNNCKLLSRHISCLDLEREIIDTVYYPGLKESYDYKKFMQLKAPIPFFNLSFKSKFSNHSFFEKFIQLILEESRKNNVDMVHGTSFGFDSISVYYTLKWDGFGDEFIRISPGDEYNLSKIKQVFTNVFKKLKSNQV